MPRNWQKLNVVAFLTSGIGSQSPHLIGEPYRDADDVAYLPMLAHPAIVLSGDGAAARRGLRRSRKRALTIAVYIDAMSTTGNDAGQTSRLRINTAAAAVNSTT